MKKYLLCIIALLCVLTVGCMKKGENDIVKNLTKKIENSKAYHLTGTLEMVNNENSYLYDVDVSYQKDDNFRVSLKNQTNNHEQIILKNSEGVYVLTPSLNKSFKFQSEWPYNNSQSYLLQSILKDIKDDTERTYEEKEDGYIFTAKANYSNNPDLKKQKITVDKDLNVKTVEVMDESGVMQIKMQFNDIDLKATFADNYFDLKENVNVSVTEDTTVPVTKIEDIIYPMYIPENTTLTSQDKVSKTDGERIILTFSGDKPFMLVQETIAKTDELITIPVSGEPIMFADTVGAKTDSSVTWLSNGLEYYLVSDILTDEELVSIAKSVSALPVMK